MRAVEVLVVEDFEPFRRFIRSMLRERTEFRLVGEACNGLEAVRKIEELRPDLILLDIGLANLNGIQVAKQASTLAPHAKLLFISQESSSDVIEKAFEAGGQGYVYKARAPSDLLPAIEAVLEGKQFVGTGLEFRAGMKPQASHHHEILFCSDDTTLLDGLSRFTEAALSAGNAAIVLVSEAHRALLEERLHAKGVDLEAAIQRGTYIPVRVREMLSKVMVNDWPDADRFSRAVDDLIKRAAEGETGECRGVVACGECSPALWAQGNVEAAIRLEHLFDEVSRMHRIDTLCVYPFLDGQADDHAFKSLCAEHTAVYSQ